jgi:hypothetical protein
MQKVRQVRRHYSATAEGLAAEGGRAEGKGRAGRGPSQGPAGALASGNPTGSTGAMGETGDAGPVRTTVKRIRAGARPMMPGARGVGYAQA